MATGPTISTNPIELLTPDLSRPEPIYNKVWGPALLGSIAFAGVCYANYAGRRPMFSGVQRHAIITTIAATVGYYADQWRSGYLAERDAVLRHYIQLHPEDFPDFERKKYADVLERWIPIR